MSLCPPPKVPPTIFAQYATAVDTDGATLKAQINPHFWPDTTYYVQYGSGRCSEGGCDKSQPLAPGSKLSAAVVNAPLTSTGILLSGLTPGTTYHYRFVAQSGGGGPVVGVGGTVGSEGSEGTFHTFPSAGEAAIACPNQAFRISAGAKLPDCRAYEMISPVDKNGGDIATGTEVGFTQVSADGQRATYASERSFADIRDEGLTNPEGLAHSDIKRAVVTLPEGFTTNPSLAEGLNTCSEADLARETVNSAPGAGCPDAAKIGTVEVQTPLLGENVNGSLFIAKPYENPFGSLLALYLVIKNPQLGIVIKQALKVESDPVSGRITTVADNLPQLPFSHFKLHFREGTRSPLPHRRVAAPTTPRRPSPPGPEAPRSPPPPPSRSSPAPAPGPARVVERRPSGPTSPRAPSTTPPGNTHPSTCTSQETTAKASSPASRSSCLRASPASSPGSPSVPTPRSPQQGEDRKPRRTGRARQPQLPQGK